MTTDRIVETFVRYFTRHHHRHLASSSLVPDNDPSVLLTTAGMQQFKPFFTGTLDPSTELGTRRAVTVQRCFRTSDIESVGDATHLTFFEMLGNFSFGDYFKADAVRFAWEFLTGELKLDPERLFATVFAGDAAVPADAEAMKLWLRHVPAGRVHRFGRDDNWWGPTGDRGPMGPSSEVHYDRTGVPCSKGKACVPNCDCGRFVEIWNLVFVQFERKADGSAVPLPKPSVDTGMGLERLAMVLADAPTVFGTDRFTAILKVLDRVEHLKTVESELERTRRYRIIADHMKGVVFLLFDGVSFGTKAQGSILRRLFRRSLDLLVDPRPHLDPLVNAIAHLYQQEYPELKSKLPTVLEAVHREADAYDRVIRGGVDRVLKKRRGSAEREIEPRTPSHTSLDPAAAFEMITAYGVSAEALRVRGFRFDSTAVEKLLEAHRAVSREGAKQKFGGHGLDDVNLDPTERQAMTRMHTATHLLHQALRTVLGPMVQQAGSDIKPDRFRFDFTFPRKVQPEELAKVEELVNTVVQQDLPVSFRSLPLSEAKASGALAFFKERYPETVTVYTVGDEARGTVFSREICGGPHVTRTGEIGTVTILKEEASSAGVRRIRARVEPRP